ncbi:5-oxoprolinase subunit PxpA [Gammaproteobacteria bacterium AS21]
MQTIDLNSDLGEGFGAYTIADDDALLKIVSSANIACGYHAGDPMVMDKTVRRALECNVAVGAHIGYPDKQGFGRRGMMFSLRELELMTIYQLGALQAITEAAGGTLQHANFHGALGNLSFIDTDVARTLVKAIKVFDPNLKYIGLPHTAAAQEAERIGLQVVYSFLADRAYTADGLLVPRSQPGSVIKDAAQITERVKCVVSQGIVTTIDGNELKMPVNSILIHSDTTGALALADTIRNAVLCCDSVIKPYGQL